MAVYFISRADYPEIVKVGSTDRLEDRMVSLSGQFGCIELLAQCDGGLEVERTFHALFAATWVEGEWYKRTPIIDGIIEKFADGVSGKRFWGRLRAIETMDHSPIETDKTIARNLLKRIMDSFGAETFASLLTSSFELLSGINPAWSHRRVRAIWNSEASRIDHFEVRDLEAAVALVERKRAAA